MIVKVWHVKDFPRYVHMYSVSDKEQVVVVQMWTNVLALSFGSDDFSFARTYFWTYK